MSRVLLRTQAWGTVQDRRGNALSSLSVLLKTTGGGAATHYSAESGGTSSTASLTTDDNGGIVLASDLSDRWVDVGTEYDLTVNGTTYRVMSTGGGTAVSTTISPSGDTTGATDYTTVQAAITALEANVYPNQGGKIELAAGTFDFNQPLTITSDNVTIVGQGMGNPTGATSGSNPLYGGTVLRAASGFTGSAILKFGQASPTRTLSGCFVRDLSIDAQRTTGSTQGIFWQVFKGGIDRVYIYKPAGDGVRLDGNSSTSFPNGCWDNHFFNVVTESAGGNGIGGTYATDNTFVGCTTKYSTGHGVYLDANSPSNMFTTHYSYNNTGKGFQCDTAMEQKIIGARVQDCNGGIYMVGSNGQGAFVINACTLRNCSFTTDNTTDAINISSDGVHTSQGGIISGCSFSVNQGNGNGTGPNFNRPRYLINLADGNVVTVAVGPYEFSGPVGGAGAFGTAAFKDLGTNTRILAAIGESGLPEIKHTGNLRMFWRSGSPEGVVTAGPGAIIFNEAGGAGTTLYVKESGTGNTGWIGYGAVGPTGPAGSPFGTTVATYTANHTLVQNEVALGNATAGAFTFTFPTAVGFTGSITVKAITTNSNLITLATTSAQTIDGNASGTLFLGAPSSTAQYASIIAVSDGANWRIV